MKDLFGNEEKPKAESLHRQFQAIWERKFPGIPLRFPRDGKVLNSIIAQTVAIMKRAGIEDEERAAEWWDIVLDNLPVWFKGKTLPVIDSHYPSIIDQILKHATTKTVSKFSRQAIGENRTNSSSR